MNRIISLLAIALVLISCDRQDKDCPGSIQQTFDFTGFTKIIAGETFQVNVIKGAVFSVKAVGCAADIDDLDLEILPGGFLDLKYSHYKKNRSRMEFLITMPQLYSVNLSGAANGSVEGFQGQTSVIRNILSGSARCTVTGIGINSQVDLSGTSELELNGSTESLYGTISGNALLQAYGVNAIEVDISVSGIAKAYVKVIESLFVEASGQSRVHYRGNPINKSVVTSGNAQVIQE